MDFNFTFTDDHGAIYTPWTDGARVGFKVQRAGGTIFMTILPSSGSDQVDDTTSTAFVRFAFDDVENDDAHAYFDLFDADGPRIFN